MISRFLSQKCMDFPNSSFFARRPSYPSSSSSSVRPPSRPSVAVVRRRRPLSEFHTPTSISTLFLNIFMRPWICRLGTTTTTDGRDGRTDGTDGRTGRTDGQRTTTTDDGDGRTGRRTDGGRRRRWIRRTTGKKTWIRKIHTLLAQKSWYHNFYILISFIIFYILRSFIIFRCSYLS